MSAVLDQPDITSAHASQPYPSPNDLAIGAGTGPFYSHPKRTSSIDGIRLAAPTAHSNPPSVTDSMADARAMASAFTHVHSRPGASPPDQITQETNPTDDPTHADTTTPRKRSKVSRACDECRRKKIRCDATSESGLEQCSSCKRVGTRCQFSRVPMKRGPSKGYIKELADRVNTLENSMIAPQSTEVQYDPAEPDVLSPRASDEYSPLSSTATSASKQPRKRTHSATHDVTRDTYLPGMPQRSTSAVWSAQDAPRHLPHPTSTLPNPTTPRSAFAGPDTTYSGPFRTQVSPNGLQAQSLWKHGPPDVGRRSSASLPYESSDTRSLEHDQSDTILDWDEQMTDEYYTLIHPTFPLLCNSKSRLRSRLANCPVTLREAFLETLYAAVRSFPRGKAAVSPSLHATKKATDLIAASQFESAATRTNATNLIYLQTMVLMAVEADNHGPAVVRGQPGPPRAVWLGSAVGLAYHLRLHMGRTGEKPTVDEDLDSDEQMGRRNWWVLVMMDRWHAASTSSPLLIPDTSVALLPEDKVLLGDTAFHLARLSSILGHLASTFTATSPELSPTSASAPFISKLLHGELDRFREFIHPSLSSQPLVHLSYWHVLLLTNWHTPSSLPRDLLGPVKQLVTILNTTSIPSTPLNHHFAALAALTLVELADASETRDEARTSLQNLTEALDRRSSPSDETTSWDDVMRGMIRKRKQSSSKTTSGTASGSKSADQGSLQHLADLAVRGEQRSSTSPPQTATEKTQVPEHTALTRSGYLTVLARDSGLR